MEQQAVPTGSVRQPHADEVARLERLRGDRPGASVFPALAEAHRRAGEPEKAARVAREGLAERPDLPAGRVALALALLDLGRVDEARGELSRVLDEVPGHALAAAALEAPSAPAEPDDADLGSLDEGELDAAFEAAEAEPERMLDANHVAEATLRQVERGEPEGVDATREDSPFATETVAALLERQGHGDRAQAVRAAAARRGTAPRHLEATPRERASVLATLERWLENVRRRKR